MQQLQQLLTNAPPSVIVAVTAVALLFVSTDKPAIVERIKRLPFLDGLTTPKTKLDRPTLKQQVKSIRERTCVYSPEERNAIADNLDQIERAIERSMIEEPDKS